MSVSQIEWPANGKRKAPSFSSKHSDLPSPYFMPIVIFKQDFGSAEGMPVNNQYVVCWNFFRTVPHMVTWISAANLVFQVYDFSVPWFQGMSVQITSHSSHTSPADSDIPDRFIFLACEWSLELSTWCCCFCEASIIGRIKPFLFMLDSDSSLKSFKLMLNCSRKRPFPVVSAATKLWQTKLSPINIQWFFLFLVQKWFGNTSWV